MKTQVYARTVNGIPLVTLNITFDGEHHSFDFSEQGAKMLGTHLQVVANRQESGISDFTMTEDKE